MEPPSADRLPAGRRAVVVGKTDERDYDFDCDLVESGPSLAVLVTRSDPAHRIAIRPRYVGGSLGTPSVPAGGTISTLELDGRYAALCTYWELPKGVLVVPLDYAPTLTPEEAVEVDARVSGRRRELGGH